MCNLKLKMIQINNYFSSSSSKISTNIIKPDEIMQLNLLACIVTQCQINSHFQSKNWAVNLNFIVLKCLFIVVPNTKFVVFFHQFSSKHHKGANTFARLICFHNSWFNGSIDCGINVFCCCCKIHVDRR